MQGLQQPFRPFPRLFLRLGQAVQRRDLANGRTVAIGLQSPLQTGQGHLIDAQGPQQGMVFHGIQIGGFTDDDTRLRAAQELVAAESHDIAASVQHFADRRFMRQSPCGQIDEQAAADIVDAGQSVYRGPARAVVQSGD